MRIHITTDAPAEAAATLMAHMREQGGEWIVNAMQKEGFMAARVGTFAGQSLERSLSPCLCGPFNARWSLGVIEDDMREANEIGYGMKTSAAGRSKRGRPRHTGKPQGDEIAVVEILREKPMAAATVAERAGWKTKKAADLLRKLLDRGCVVITGREMTPGNFVERHVYGVAA